MNDVFCGNKKVSIEEKKSFVKSIFSDVHRDYDMMNNIMSLGMHHLWKNKFINLMNRCLMYKKNALILDVASGTGDIAIKFLKQDINDNRIILSDINVQMLNIAYQRIIDENLFKVTNCIVNDAAYLPIKSESIDLYSVVFGIRNFANITKALEEAYRVLKPYSYFLCMEFSPIKQGCFSKIYNLYSEKLIPFLGRKIANNEEAYKYLVDSINSFPNKNAFKEMIENAGFDNVHYFELNFGSVVIHIGQKLK